MAWCIIVDLAVLICNSPSRVSCLNKARIEKRGAPYLWGLIDTRRYHLLIANTGGNAIDCWVYAGRHDFLKEYGPHEIASHKHIDLNIGHSMRIKNSALSKQESK